MNPNYYYPQPANNYSQNIAPVFPWSPPVPNYGQNYAHVPPGSPLIPPFSTSIQMPSHGTLPSLRGIYNEYSNNSNNSSSVGNNNSNLLVNTNHNNPLPANNSNNVNMIMDDHARREPNSASESDLSKSTMTPTKKKVLERANKLKKHPIEVDPEYVPSMFNISLFQ